MESMVQINCPACSAANRKEARFCAACGNSIHTLKNCANCEQPNTTEAQFCRHCGASTSDESKVCASCSARNLRAANFCRNCAAPLEEASARSQSEEIPSADSTVSSQEQVSESAADHITNSSAAPDSSRFEDFVRAAKGTLAEWYAEAWRFGKERPFVAIGVAAGVVIVLTAGVLWSHHRQTTAADSGTTQVGSASSGTLYATRLTHIRNAPTSIGTVVIGDVQASEAVSGIWVLGPDGVTRWLRIRRSDGSYGFVWGNNLSPLPSSQATTGQSQEQFSYIAGLDPNGDNWLALRSEPSLYTGTRLAKLGPDTLFAVLGQQHNWAQVRLRSGEIGWVSSKFVACCKSALEISPSDNLIGSNDAKEVTALIEYLYAGYTNGAANRKSFFDTVPWDIETSRLVDRIRKCEAAKELLPYFDFDWPSASQDPEITNLTVTYLGSTTPGMATVRASFGIPRQPTDIDYDMHLYQDTPLPRRWGVSNIRIHSQALHSPDLLQAIGSNLAGECRGY